MRKVLQRSERYSSSSCQAAPTTGAAAGVQDLASMHSTERPQAGIRFLGAGRFSAVRQQS